jgi:non-canonical poly(A) RNA polymerase PAPD5/7
VAATRAVTQDVRDTIKKWSPRDESEAFGSQTTGLALATSDIDIRLYESTNKDRVKAPEYRSRKAMNAHLRRLREKLVGGSHEYIMARMRHARYPLISLMHRKSGLDIQIVASNNTSHSRKLIKQYLEEYPNLHAIYALIKSMLDIRGLTDVFRGGLGSYSLFMMIVAALKMNDTTSLGQEAVWKQLVAVLNFYAGLDTYQRALTLQPPYSVAKHNFDSPFPATEESQLAEASVRRSTNLELEFVADSEQHLEGLHKLALIDPLQPYLLCLQDPADPFNDLGKKGYGYKHIQATFKRLKSYINQEAALSTKEGWKGSILDRTVGPCFEAYKARRAMTEAYGQEILDAERAAKEAEEKATVQKIVEAEAADV